jgi:hypothetical protein
MQFFGHRSRPAAEAVHPDHVIVTHGEVHPTAADVEAAYKRGRKDGRASKRRSPLLTLAVAVVALAGAGVIALAAREGSFSRGGQVVDQKLAVAADQAVISSRDAATAAAEAARDAGHTLRNSADRPG